MLHISKLWHICNKQDNQSFYLRGCLHECTRNYAIKQNIFVQLSWAVGGEEASKIAMTSNTFQKRIKIGRNFYVRFCNLSYYEQFVLDFNFLILRQVFNCLISSTSALDKVVRIECLIYIGWTSWIKIAVGLTVCGTKSCWMKRNEVPIRSGSVVPGTSGAGPRQQWSIV